MKRMNSNETLTFAQTDLDAEEGMRLPAAVFWDMDGTLIDSEPYWADGERYVIEKHGGQWSDDVPLRARGQSTPRLLEILKEYISEPVDTEVLRCEIIGYVIGREKETPCWTTGSLELQARRRRHSECHCLRFPARHGAQHGGAGSRGCVCRICVW